MKQNNEVRLYKSGIKTKPTQRPHPGPDVTWQHPAGIKAGRNYTEKQNNGLRPVGHLDYADVQTSKHKDYPDNLGAIDYTERMAATDGKYDCNTDGPYIHDSDVAGWRVNGDTLGKSKSVGLANNKIRATVLDADYLPYGRDEHLDGKPIQHVNKVRSRHDCIIDTVHGHTMYYNPYERI